MLKIIMLVQNLTVSWFLRPDCTAVANGKDLKSIQNMLNEDGKDLRDTT